MIHRTHAVVEGFEARRLLNAAWVDQGVLHVTGGDSRDDRIGIVLVASETDAHELVSCRVRINAREWMSFPVDQIDSINVRGGRGNDSISCSGDGLLLPSRAISFTFIGGRGNDTIGGAALGDVLMRGNGGNDTLLINSSGSAANGRIDGGGGEDIINGGIGPDLITGGGGTDFILGYGGNDTIFGGDVRDVISGDDGNDLIFGGAGDDSADGNAGDDAVFGGEGNDTIRGWGGDDLLLGNAGDDNLHGGDTIGSGATNDGNDRLYGGTGTDLLNGGDQTNTVRDSELPTLAAMLDHLRSQLPAEVQDLVTA